MTDPAIKILAKDLARDVARICTVVATVAYFFGFACGGGVIYYLHAAGRL